MPEETNIFTNDFGLFFRGFYHLFSIEPQSFNDLSLLFSRARHFLRYTFVAFREEHFCFLFTYLARGTGEIFLPSGRNCLEY